MGLGWVEVKMEKEEKKMNIGMNRYWFLVVYSLMGEIYVYRVVIVSKYYSRRCCKMLWKYRRENYYFV